MGSGSSRRRGPAGRTGHSRDLPGTAPADGEGAAAAPGPGRPAPAAGGSAEPRAGGSSVEAAGGGGAPLQQAVSRRKPVDFSIGKMDVSPQKDNFSRNHLCQALSTRSPPGPENNNLDHQCPESNKKPLGQSTVLYDYSEEELMASIEREYCR